jgi:hypothetical protein
MKYQIRLCALLFIKILGTIEPSLAMDHDEIFSYRTQTAIKNLGSDKSFAYYDLQLSENEINALQNLKISETDSYDNYGNLKVLEPEVSEFIKSVGKGNETSAKDVSQLIMRLVNDILQGSGQETAWVAVRAFTPTSAYDVPRWHTDGYYFEPYEGNPYKFALTLKGAPTLFYRLPNDKREEFNALQCKGTEQNKYNRQELAALLEMSKEAMSIAEPYQGIVFIVGSDNAAVHSEPAIKEERLFLSVLPGSKKKIKEWETQ